MKMDETEFVTPPAHVNFRAKKLFGCGEMKDASLAFIGENGGGPMECHTHSHDHLFIVSRGEARVILGDETRIIKENESILVRGDIPHSVWNNAAGECVIIGINIENERGFENE